MKDKLKNIVTRIITDPNNDLDGISYEEYNEIYRIIKNYSDFFSLYSIAPGPRDNILYKGEILYRT